MPYRVLAHKHTHKHQIHVPRWMLVYTGQIFTITSIGISNQKNQQTNENLLPVNWGNKVPGIELGQCTKS